jgi:hypothetical protein
VIAAARFGSERAVCSGIKLLRWLSDTTHAQKVRIETVEHSVSY